MLQGPPCAMIRPHPAVWRLVHGVVVVYLSFLVFLLYQTPHDARQFMKAAPPTALLVPVSHGSGLAHLPFGAWYSSFSCIGTPPFGASVLFPHVRASGGSEAPPRSVSARFDAMHPRQGRPHSVGFRPPAPTEPASEP